jgi:tartrate dehydrogenase/decarboxylase/D-malate dehydrogenase
MFEPVHGSAPDIAGRGVANPVGAMWSAVLMLDHLGRPSAAGDLMRAVETSLASPDTRTPDVGGTARTADVTAAVLRLLAAS